MQDKQIIQMYLDRNDKAISETKIAYGSYLLTIAYNILSSNEDAEEVENDTYLHAWNVIPPQVPLKLKIFLAKITRNLSLDMYRKKHAEKRGGAGCDMLLSELEEVLPELAAGVDNETPAEALDSAELTRAINAFLSEQEKQRRVMFVKRYFYGESISQIATELGITESKVATTLHRMRMSLKEYLEKEEIAV